MAKGKDEIGALWRHESKDGKAYWSGVIRGERVLVFHNANNVRNQPDFRVVSATGDRPIEGKATSEAEDVPF